MHHKIRSTVKHHITSHHTRCREVLTNTGRGLILNNYIVLRKKRKERIQLTF